jgi:hypothetical protein
VILLLVEVLILGALIGQFDIWNSSGRHAKRSLFDLARLTHADSNPKAK